MKNLSLIDLIFHRIGQLPISYDKFIDFLEEYILDTKFLIENLFGSKAQIKILNILVKEKELNISSLINKTRLNHTNILRHLNFLKTRGLIQEKKFGRIRIFRYKNENIKARALENFIHIWED